MRDINEPLLNKLVAMIKEDMFSVAIVQDLDKNFLNRKDFKTTEERVDYAFGLITKRARELAINETDGHNKEVHSEENIIKSIADENKGESKKANTDRSGWNH